MRTRHACGLVLRVWSRALHATVAGVLAQNPGNTRSEALTVTLNDLESLGARLSAAPTWVSNRTEGLAALSQERQGCISRRVLESATCQLKISRMNNVDTNKPEYVNLFGSENCATFS